MFFIWGVTGGAVAAVLDVGVGYPYATLDDAYAASVNGDRIELHDALVEASVLVAAGEDRTFASSVGTVWVMPEYEAYILNVHGTARVEGITFELNREFGSGAYDFLQVWGGSLVLSGSTVMIDQSSSQPNSSAYDGGVFRIEDSTVLDTMLWATNGGTLELVRTTLGSQPFPGVGSEVVLTDGGSAWIEDAAFVDDHSNQTIVVYDIDSTLTVLRTSFVRLGNNGILCGDGASCVVEDSYFEGGSIGPVFEVADDAHLEVRRTRVCPGTGTSVAASVHGTALFENNLVVGWGSTDGAAAVLDLLSGQVELRNNTLVFGGTLSGAGAVSSVPGTSLLSRNNTYVGFDGALPAVVAYAPDQDFDLFFDNAPSDTNFPVGPSTVTGADPLLWAPDPLSCTFESVWPQPGSPLIDAGDPSGLPDHDGTVPDIGAFSGPGAPVLPDEDGDGLPGGVDCDDWDAAVTFDELHADLDSDGVGVDAFSWGCLAPGWSLIGGDCDDAVFEVHSGAAEICNDIDDDCDGLVDDGDPSIDPATQGQAWIDADRDGFGDAELRACELPADLATVPGDCDDGDPDVHPGAVEIPDNAVDEDCDGVAAAGDPTDPDPDVTDTGPSDADPSDADPSGARSGCGCAGVGGRGPSGLGVAVLLGALVRRGSRPRRPHGIGTQVQIKH